MANATSRTAVRRLPERGRYDLAEIRAILDSNFICHVALVADHGPVVLPTLFGRDGDTIYMHGSTGAHMLRSMKDGADVSVAVTNVDGIVVARSLFHHSINYRSVVVFGKAAEVTDVEEKLHGLKVVTNHVMPGRWDEARRPSSKEFTQTAVVKLLITESSAKVRTGNPKDEPEDMSLPVWAGVVPLYTRLGTPVPDSHLAKDIKPSPSVAAATRKWSTAPAGA